MQFSPLIHTGLRRKEFEVGLPKGLPTKSSNIRDKWAFDTDRFAKKCS